jgi:hypothetical protein
MDFPGLWGRVRFAHDAFRIFNCRIPAAIQGYEYSRKSCRRL